MLYFTCTMIVSVDLSRFSVHLASFSVHLASFSVHLASFSVHLASFSVHLASFRMSCAEDMGIWGLWYKVSLSKQQILSCLG